MSSLSLKQFQRLHPVSENIKPLIIKELCALFSGRIPWSEIRKDLEYLKIFNFTDAQWYSFKSNAKRSADKRHFFALLFWMYNGRHSRASKSECIAAANRICRKLFDGRSIDEAYEAKFGKILPESNEAKNSAKDAGDGNCVDDLRGDVLNISSKAEMNWLLEVIGEPSLREYGFFDCSCPMEKKNTGSDEPARIGFQCYLDKIEFEGLLYGFKEAYIETTLQTNNGATLVEFHSGSACEGGSACGDATVGMAGPANLGIWIIRKNDRPLEGNYYLAGDTITIDILGVSHDFKVAFGIHRFSSSVCWESGDPIDDDNKRCILDMLLGEVTFKRPPLTAKKIKLSERSYRLSRVEP